MKDFTLPHTLHPVTVARTVAGPVFTLRGKVTPTADPHETLLAWTGFLSKAKSGHVVVIVHALRGGCACEHMRAGISRSHTRCTGEIQRLSRGILWTSFLTACRAKALSTKQA